MNWSLSHLNHEYLPNSHALFAKSKFRAILHSRPQNAAGAIAIVAGVRVYKQRVGGTIPQAGLLDHVLRRLRTQEFLGQLWGADYGEIGIGR